MIFSIAMVMLALFVGTAIGFYWAYSNLKARVEKMQSEGIYKAQVLLYAHLAVDEVFRRRFNKWAVSAKGHTFINKMENVEGTLVKLPISDDKQMKVLMDWLDSVTERDK